MSQQPSELVAGDLPILLALHDEEDVAHERVVSLHTQLPEQFDHAILVNEIAFSEFLEELGVGLRRLLCRRILTHAD